MFKLSKLADYATVVMTHLARHADEALSAAQIAKSLGLSATTVAKLLKALARAELLSSTRGANGGYQLAKAPVEITLAQIIAAVDGDMAVTECCEVNATHCAIEPQCEIKGHWQVISRAFYQALASVSVADMCEPTFNQGLLLQQGITESLLEKTV